MNLAMDLIREALLGSDGGGGGGGGGDSFELVYSKDYEINQSSSTAITVDTIELTNTLKRAIKPARGPPTFTEVIFTHIGILRPSVLLVSVFIHTATHRIIML